MLNNLFDAIINVKQDLVMPFNYDLDFELSDFRKQPELYRIGIGEQGVLLVQPYKSEILPFWRYKSTEIATESSSKIYELFRDYLAKEDFVGADMARKFLQMGFTRARRYANHKSSRKYTQTTKISASNLPDSYSSGSSNKNNQVLTQESDVLDIEKAQAAAIFKEKWFLAKENEIYKRLATNHKQKYGN